MEKREDSVSNCRKFNSSPDSEAQDPQASVLSETQKLIYEYCLLRYVPDVEREEYVNVGLMMMCKKRRWMKVGLHIDEDRIKALSGKADIDRLKTQLALFERNDAPEAALPVEERYRWLAAVKSAIIQTSPSHPGILRHASEISPEVLTDLLSTQFHSLFSRLVL